MKVFLGSDHNGFYLKDRLFAYLAKYKYEVVDISGGKELDPEDDFPEFAQSVAIKVLGEDDSRGILLCGSGQGMAMAANRFNGIRAAVVWDAYEAKMTRRDNDSNVLCLSARAFESQDDAVWQGIVETWLNTEFTNAPRFRRRNKQLDEIS